MFASFNILRNFYHDSIKETSTVQDLADIDTKKTYNLSQPCSNATILSSYAMGLGNLMFIYASLFGISKNNKKNYFMPTYFNFPLFQFFNLSSPELDINYNTWDRLPESKCCQYDPNVESLPCNKNYLITGYRQSYKYFSNYFNEIKKEFAFVGESNDICRKEMTRLFNWNNCSWSKKECVFVGLHIRRGNFLNQEQVNYGYLSADSSYVENSIRYMETKFSVNFTIYFLVFGNDYRWNVENISTNVSETKRNFIFFNSFSSVVDMCLLSLCNHTIITTGSFGWWSAFLSNGTVVYMKNQCRSGSHLCSQFTMSDYVLPHWIAL